MFIDVLDCALLEHCPGLERLIRLLHAAFKLFEHLLPAVRVRLLVIVHRLDERHVEVLRRKLTLVEQLLVLF